jgi:hypothetical protein
MSPDGATILVGGQADGVWRAPSATLMLEKVSSVAVQCLTWGSAGVYACAGEFNDGFTVGLSADQGTSFSPVMHLSCLRGPLACGADTEVGQQCPAVWPATAEVIDQASCAPDAGVDGGMPDAGPGPGPAGGGDDDTGCGCRAAPSKGVGAWFAGLALGIVMLAVRRGRR